MRLGEEAEDEPLTVVGGITARELVISGADFEIDDEPKLEAECTVIVWYDDNADDTVPLVVEFSFRYKDKDEEYSGGAAQRAFNVFDRVRSMKKWVDPKSKTKTGFVYDLANHQVEF